MRRRDYDTIVFYEMFKRGFLELAGIINPNRRHDDPDEKLEDNIRTQICASHRFESFADERAQNFVKWCAFRAFFCKRPPAC